MLLDDGSISLAAVLVAVLASVIALITVVCVILTVFALWNAIPFLVSSIEHTAAIFLSLIETLHLLTC